MDKYKRNETQEYYGLQDQIRQEYQNQTIFPIYNQHHNFEGKHVRQLSEELMRNQNSKLDTMRYDNSKMTSQSQSKHLLTSINMNSNDKKMQLILSKLNDKKSNFKSPALAPRCKVKYATLEQRSQHQQSDLYQQNKFVQESKNYQQNVNGNNQQSNNNTSRVEISELEKQQNKKIQKNSNTKNIQKLKELFQVKSIDIKDKISVYEDLKKRQDIQQNSKQIIDISNYRSISTLRSNLKQMDNNSSYLLRIDYDAINNSKKQHSKFQYQLKSPFLQNIECNYNSQRITQVSSKQLLDNDPTQAFNNQTIRQINESSGIDYSYDHIIQPSQRSLSTKRTNIITNKNLHLYPKNPLKRYNKLAFEPQISSQQINGQNQNNELYVLNEEDSQQKQDTQHEAFALNHNSSIQYIQDQVQIDQKYKPAKRKITPEQKRYLELKKQQERIQELMRNNYYFNNYAFSQENANPSFKKLKTRFRLYEMVIQDEDFMSRLKRRKEDVSGLNDSMIKNVYYDQEV